MPRPTMTRNQADTLAALGMLPNIHLRLICRAFHIAMQHGLFEEQMPADRDALLEIVGMANGAAVARSMAAVDPRYPKLET